ncbi:MAG: choice-of-anchor D domain-containing protein, partial [Bdellovibrionales bacterium]
MRQKLSVLALKNTTVFLGLLLSLLMLSGCGAGGDVIDKLVGVKGSLLEDGGIGNDALVFNPNPLDFGNVALNGSTQNSGITVRNNTKIAVKIINVTSPTVAQFSLTSTSCDIGDVLQPNETCVMSVSFNPNAAGTQEDNIPIDFAPVLDETLLFSNRAVIRGTAVGLLNFSGLNAILPADVTTTRVT